VSLAPSRVGSIVLALDWLLFSLSRAKVISGLIRSSWPLCRWPQNLLCKLDDSASMSVEIEHKSLVARVSWRGQAERRHILDVLKQLIA
jgi:hypothetical protein